MSQVAIILRLNRLSQLAACDALGIPTPRFQAVRYDEFRLDAYRDQIAHLSFPVQVRGDFPLQESGKDEPLFRCYDPDSLFEVIDAAFATYPEPEKHRVIVQEFPVVEVQGELMAHRNHVWKVRLRKEGENKFTTLYLPKFSRADIPWSRWWHIWRPGENTGFEKLARPLIALSAYCGDLMTAFQDDHQYGLKISFFISRRRIGVSGFDPIDSEAGAEDFLTPANHREIFPPAPSPFMSGMIASCSRHLFAYYQQLDPSVAPRNFIELSGGMPWIHLSALLDLMVHWGLPTGLVTQSVGAPDPYQVKTRPYRAIAKWPVIALVLKDTLDIAGKVKSWIQRSGQTLQHDIEARRKLWFQNPDLAFTNWLTQSQLVYVDLVKYMQALTAAVSGPTRWLDRWGYLHRLPATPVGERLAAAFKKLGAQPLTQSGQLKGLEHMGFYPSDLGQPRLGEWSDQEWQLLNRAMKQHVKALPDRKKVWFGRLLDPVTELIATREVLREATLILFAKLREELRDQTQALFGPEFDFARYHPEDLAKGIEARWKEDEWARVEYPPAEGWDHDLAVIAHGEPGRRNLEMEESSPGGPTAIVPGRVTGRIWRVPEARTEYLVKPFEEPAILLADSLNPGWIPFFLQSQAVMAYTGGLLSHAAVLLRDLGLPSMTQVSRELTLVTGDWVEMNSQEGWVRRVEPKNIAVQAAK